MYAEDRVLVGVINRKRDLETLQRDRWYRIPQAHMPRGVFAEYLAFFSSGGAVPKGEKAGIFWVAERRGVELTIRRDLLPNEVPHPRADEWYYKVQVGELMPKDPPIRNTTRRPLTFIHTTGDRFQAAETIRDLYSSADWFVNRLTGELVSRGIEARQTWENEQRHVPPAPGFEVECRDGRAVFSLSGAEGTAPLDMNKPQSEILHEILAEIDRRGGPVMLSLT
ncbi:MAG: hypothetical protein SF162_02090 [bacterium]|nr:hypothetical protein [bacterium]